MCNAGTVAYVAPEVLQRGIMAMPADVYSYSMLMLELWNGERVYNGINSHQVSALLCSCLKDKYYTTSLHLKLQEPGGSTSPPKTHLAVTGSTMTSVIGVCK